MLFYYECDPSYNCRCHPGKAVTRQTAMAHRKKEEIRLLSIGHHVYLPLPQKLSRLSSMNSPCEPVSYQIPDSDVANVSEFHHINNDHHETSCAHSHLTSSDPYAIHAHTRNSSSTASRSTETERCSTKSNTDLQFLEGDMTEAGSTSDNSFHHFGSPLKGSRDFRLHSFMSKHADLVGLSVKHHATEALMDDLLADACSNDPPDERYVSFKGVKKALLRSSGLSTSSYPFCAESHQALLVNLDHSIVPCDEKNCANTPRTTRYYQYIELWPQLLGRIQSDTYGPLMYEYYRDGILRSSTSADEGEYVDFFSGYNFQTIQESLGGMESIRNDIFVHLTTDGVQPFRSTSYSYWPVVITIANLPPHERYKIHHMLPVIIIPGPKNPKDLPSFLKPLLEELLHLSVEGKVVKLWNGQKDRVCVHMLTVQVDLVAMAKITYLSAANGTVPCRFCLIEGVYVSVHRHTYFPQAVYEMELGHTGKRRKVIRVLWNPASLPKSSDVEVRETYKRIEDLRSRGRVAEAKRMAQRNGFNKDVLEPSPLLELPTLFAFDSFPVDIMHLLYCNVAKITVEYWFSTESCMEDVAVLSSKRVFQGVECSLRAAGTGISSSSCRRPRGLSDRGSWKANEWKYFVTTTSLVVLHEWIPKHILDGWSLFCRLCTLVSQWKLTERQVVGIEKLAQRFYRHFNKYYYNLREDRIHLCRYVFHLLLHLGDSIRANGPVSMLAQWSMKTFAGVVNRRCNAKDLFAESVAENTKLEAAARLYGIKRGLKIPHLQPFTEEEEDIASNLRCRSDLVNLDGFEFRHPRYQVTIDAADCYFPNLRKLMIQYYESSMTISREDAENLLQQHSDLVIWQRLSHDKAAHGAPYIYRSFRSADENWKERSSCHFAAFFQSEDERFVDLSYGKALAYIEHRIGTTIHMLLLAAWVTTGLHIREQLQVYARRPRSRESLFSRTTIESVHSISHPVSVIQCEVPNRLNGLSIRTYFVDEMRAQHGFMTGRKWRLDIPGVMLQGLVPEYENKQRRAWLCPQREDT